MNIIDVMKKYKLQLLEKHNKTVSKVLGSTSAIIIIAVAITAKIVMKRKRNNKKTHSNIFRMSDLGTATTTMTYQAADQIQKIQSEETQGIPFKTETQNKQSDGESLNILHKWFPSTSVVFR